MFRHADVVSLCLVCIHFCCMRQFYPQKEHNDVTLYVIPSGVIIVLNLDFKLFCNSS